MTGELTSGWLAAEDLTDPEKALVAAALDHRWWPPPPEHPEEVTEAPQDADWGEERTVRAQVLYQLLTGQGGPTADRTEWAVPPRAVRVRGARIMGQLDLVAATLRCPLELVGCWLDHDAAPVLLAQATAPAIRLRGCWLPAGLDAQQVTTHGDVDLRRCRIHGKVQLYGGHVGGLAILNGAKLRNQDKTALDAEGMQVNRSVFCVEEFEADGEVRLLGVHVGGQLNLTGGKFRNKGGTALIADGMQVDQGMFCRKGFEADGKVSLAGGHVGGQVDLSGGKFRNKGETALAADVLKVDQSVFCAEGFEADGEVRLVGGHVGGQLVLTGGKFRNENGRALNADGLLVDRDVVCRKGFEADGEVRLTSGHVGGQVDLSGGKFRNKGGTALNARQLEVEQNVLCMGEFEADGEVRLIGGHVGGELNLTGGKFRNESKAALDADGLRVDRDVVCGQGFEADGLVRLVGGYVRGQLDLSGGKFRNKGGTALAADVLKVDLDMNCGDGFEADGEVLLRGGHVGRQLELAGEFRNEDGRALNADHVQVEGSVRWWPADVTGRVSFQFGSVGVWVDRPAVLGIPVVLHGLRYDGLYPAPPEVKAADRVAWLNRNPDGYSPQPYSQLAAVYRAQGYDRAARKMLIASQTRRRRRPDGRRGWAGRAWGRLLWATVGYGYRPWLALLWLVALIVGGAFVVDALPDSDFEPGSGAPAFNSLLYTVDVLLPFIDLGYGKWVAVGVAQIMTVVLVVLGWVLATAVIAAFAGVLRRGD